MKIHAGDTLTIEVTTDKLMNGTLSFMIEGVALYVFPDVFGYAYDIVIENTSSWPIGTFKAQYQMAGGLTENSDIFDLVILEPLFKGDEIVNTTYPYSYPFSY